MSIGKCATCSREFYRKLSQLKRFKVSYCSAKCQHEGRKTGKVVRCYLCGKEAYKAQRHLQRYQRSFCSKKCSIIWQNTTFIGTKHPNWKTGEFSYKGVLLQNKVPAACVLCGVADQMVLVVHHVDKNRKNNNIKNLAWLCRNCHFLVHHYREEESKFAKLNQKEVKIHA